jgi:hypothetical protein
VRGTVARTMLACTTAMAMAPEGFARADTSCATVLVSRDLPGAWLDAVHELEHQIAQLPPSDCQAATLRIEPADGAARVVAVTPDGRRAERVVRVPGSLVATGLGLVMAIPLSPPEAPTPPASAAAPPRAAPGTPPPSPVPGPGVVTAVELPRLGLWLGFDAGGRTAVPASIAAADVSVHGDILLDHWLFTIAIRDSVVGFSPGQGVDNDTFREVNVALGVGRRLMVGDTAFDLMVAPAITAMRLEWDFGGGKDSSGEDVELSVNALARVALPISRSWALTLTVESELVPSNLASPAHVEPPAGVPFGATMPPTFPAWTGGLRFGAMGAVL